MKILVVDDVEDARIYLERGLKSQGYTVMAARNGKEALDTAREWKPDMIISDILMPEMDGFELCRIVKADNELKRVCFVFYTATFVDKKDEKLAMALGASKFVIKPVDPEEFFKIVKGAIDNHNEKNLPVPESENANKEELLLKYSESIAGKLKKKVSELEKEKEATQLLLQEVYHRTRNNMQVICSLINQQSEILKSTEAQKAFKKLENRIHFMALAHQKLYESQNLNKINMKDYITDMTTTLLKGYHKRAAEINFEFSLQDIFMPIDEAIPCSQILHELVANSINHAFPESRNGVIKLCLLNTEDGGIEIRVKDNGIGFPQGFDIKNTKSIGIQTIISLAEYQLKGKVHFFGEKGVDCKLKFKKKKPKERV